MSSAPDDANDVPFRGWDTGPHQTPYCCSFHWFRIADGRIVGLDLIRSDDTDQLGLRAWLVEADGAIKGLTYTAPTAYWVPFASESLPPLGGPKPALGRGLNWIAGSLHTSGQQLNRVVFELHVVPQSKAYNSAALCLATGVRVSHDDRFHDGADDRLAGDRWHQMGHRQ
jgi:hypothetical protein